MGKLKHVGVMFWLSAVMLLIALVLIPMALWTGQYYLIPINAGAAAVNAFLVHYWLHLDDD